MVTSGLDRWSPPGFNLGTELGLQVYLTCFVFPDGNMHRFYIAEKICGPGVTISDLQQLHHIRHVLRLKPGDEVILFDREGTEFTARIMSFDKGSAALTVTSRVPGRTKKVEIAFACAIPKKSLMDEIIDKLTQLGVDLIIPVVTERVILKIENKENQRLERWRRIAARGSEQSKRADLPQIHSITDLSGALAQGENFDLKLMPTLLAGCTTIHQLVSSGSPSRVFVLVGPEGDFTLNEVEAAKMAGFVPVSLGENVLRVETAAVAVASYLKLALQV